MLKSAARPDAAHVPGPCEAFSQPAGQDLPSDEFSVELIRIFEERIIFNQTLGLKIDRLAADRVRCRLQMQPKLVGHFVHDRLHGGVISAVLDAAGGLAVMAAIGARYQDEPPQQRLRRFEHLGTIDLRVDYLRPALGGQFVACAEVTRLGSRVATTHMKFCTAAGRTLSTGAAAYIVS